MVPQVVKLLLSELKQEVFREPVEVTFDSTIKSLGFHLIELCKISIHHDLFSTVKANLALDSLDGNDKLCIRVFREH